MKASQRALTEELMRAAASKVPTRPDAVQALLVAAGELLHRDLGPTRTIEVLRELVNETEEAFFGQLGRQAGEACQ